MKYQTEKTINVLATVSSLLGTLFLTAACGSSSSGTTSSISSAKSSRMASSGQSASILRAAEHGYVNIMPLGDSITEGFRVIDPDGTSGGYRSSLYNDLQFNFHLVGSLSSGPAGLTEPAHEGHAGDRIDEIQAGIDGWIAANPPDAVLLHIGTNDIMQDLDDGMEDRLYDLIQTIFNDAPGVTVFVAKIIPMSYDQALNPRVDAYNANLEQVVANFQDDGQNIILVDMNTGFDRSQTSRDLSHDLCHPSLIGYQKLGVRWANALNRAATQGYFSNAQPRGDYWPIPLVPAPGVRSPIQFTIPDFADM